MNGDVTLLPSMLCSFNLRRLFFWKNNVPHPKKDVRLMVFNHPGAVRWVFSKIGVPQNGWFITENPMNKRMIWGGKKKHPLFFGSTPIARILLRGNSGSDPAKGASSIKFENYGSSSHIGGRFKKEVDVPPFFLFQTASKRCGLRTFQQTPVSHTPNPQPTVYVSEFLSFGGLGMSGVCSRGVLGLPKRCVLLPQIRPDGLDLIGVSDPRIMSFPTWRKRVYLSNPNGLMACDCLIFFSVSGGVGLGRDCRGWRKWPMLNFCFFITGPVAILI